MPSAFGLAVLIAAPWSNPGAPTATETALAAASAPACYDMVSIAVAGRNDVPHEGTNQMVVAPDGTRLPASMSTDYHSNWLDPVVNAPRGSVDPDSYAAMYVEYPANMATYEDAVDAGVANTEKIIETIRKSCPNTKFAIVGYSEGSDVARRVARDIGNQTADSAGKYGIVDPASVVGVVILADSGRDAGEAPFPGAENEFAHPDGFDVDYQTGHASASGQGAVRSAAGGFGALDGKVASFCAEGDLTCSAPQDIALLQLAANIGRQVDIDAIQRDGLTPATALDVAGVVGRIAVAAMADIASQPHWMASDETLLDVMVKVSDPAYKPNVETTSDTPEQITQNQLVDIVYLPQKIRNEVVGFLADNRNTVQVAMSDPYKQTLGEGTGHHFDYWHDADAADGKPLSSAQYAAAWLTDLAVQAERGQSNNAANEPETATLAADSTGPRPGDAVAAANNTSAASDPTPTTAAGKPTDSSQAVTPPPVLATDPTTVADTATSTDAPAPTTTQDTAASVTPTETEAPTTSSSKAQPTSTDSSPAAPTRAAAHSG